MNYGIVIGVILLAFVLIKELGYYKNRIVKLRYSAFELVSVTLGELILVGAVIFFGRHLYDYLIAILAIVIFFIDWYKQGLVEKGLVTMIKGKPLYQWVEIKEAVITYDSVIKIVYYNSVGATIATQRYARQDFDQIIELFQQHSVSYQLYRIESCNVNLQKH